MSSDLLPGRPLPGRPLPDLDASGPDFTVPPELSARAPAEARGLRRDGVRLLVGRGGGGGGGGGGGVRGAGDRSAAPTVSHHRFTELAQVLRPGDLLVVNNSATLPAALPARLPGGAPITLHISSAHPAPPTPAGRTEVHGTHLVELRRPGRADEAASYLAPADNPARPGLRLSLPAGAGAVLTAAYTPRLWYARLTLPGPLPAYLAAHGKAIRYGYVDRDWPLSAYQTVFAAEPGSSEMPSAARPFTAALVSSLVARGILIAPITLHTGVASPEAHEAPYPERFRVPEATAALVAHVRATGGRVIAVGTTVVRALESATGPDGRTRAADGWTDLVVTPARGVRAVDGLLTGWHEPRASHLLMLEAVAGRPLLHLCYREALAARYLWHEFGDVNLLLPN
ncbi:S-adenosylmethionine:tRNA ribosyltransferase-isomerase [Kitasatospora sp. NBC_01287]|uniref:S-adenosylmethionine:tRNA ribosyltransferase-isomerase n=1 Tax=Kitasatospora sp. NBC_01287 TaxID=2903573 RepID=UPI0022590C74|nr:S-adenosylmethionine:tRNA ribosyltransferase-isomerase [Kitasatospora sp. NBC_01287]MCX4745211.1 S-adenosylmethionine:tRNA ribosyltransferase-isomerase [Kitasatospora sp. NBC_01287]